MSSPVVSQQRHHIGLIATLLSTAQSYRGAGIHVYCQQLLAALPQVCASYQFHAFTGDKHYQTPPGLMGHEPPFSILHPFTRILWEQAFLPFLVRQQGLDLLHGLAYATVLPVTVPSVVTVHDLTFRLFPDAFPPTKRLYLTAMSSLSCRRARRVIAVSQATATDLQRWMGVPAHKIEVVYSGVDNAFRPLPPAEVSRFAREKGWPEAFILTVGTLEPRKNHPRLLRAYAQYRSQVAQPLPLLVAGGKGWYFADIYQVVEDLQLGEHVHFLGFLPADHLPWIYNAATLFIYPSLYEGFGLPVAEAMACGTPVITSNVSSLPEAAGSAALTVDPYEVEALSEALAQCLSAPDRLLAMSQAGLSYVKRFRWSQTAAETVQVYERAIRQENG